MTRIVAEIGLSHGGNLDKALRYIKQAAEAGADLVKFQCHRGQVTPGRDWSETDFTNLEWVQLARGCDEAGVEFLCSPFTLEAVELLNPMVRRWKVASGQVTNIPLLEALSASRKPVLVSKGLGSPEELEGA